MLKISVELGFPTVSMFLTNHPVKLARMDYLNNYLLTISEDDRELVVTDVKRAFKDIARINFKDYDKKYDDLMIAPIRFAFVITKTVILLMNENGLFRLIDFSVEKPSNWHICELQKFSKFDFTLGGGPDVFLPMSEKTVVEPLIRVTSKFNYGTVESVIMVG